MQTQNDFSPTNNIERLLQAGASFDSKEFLFEILRTDLLILAKATPLPQGGHNLSFRTAATKSGGLAVFAFSSKPAYTYYRSKFELPEQDFVELHAEDFIASVYDKFDIVLNYGHGNSPYLPKGSLVPSEQSAPN